MSTKTFIAQRISGKKNVLFPDKLTISDYNVIFYKGQIIGNHQLEIKKINISSTYIHENLLFADIVIESNGGQRIVAEGFSKSDARKIINLLT